MNILMGAGSPLVLKQFQIDSQTGHVTIVGRRPGLIAFLLTAMGLDATTSFHASPHEIRVRKASFFGEQLDLFPSPSIASASCGYAKPVQLLIIAIGLLGMLPFLAMGEGETGPAIVVLLLVSIGFFIGYFISKKLYIAVVSSGGSAAVIAFKRSLIENVRVDIDQARQVIATISTNIVNTQTHGIPATLRAPAGPELGRLKSGAAPDPTCPACGLKTKLVSPPGAPGAPTTPARSWCDNCQRFL